MTRRLVWLGTLFTLGMFVVPNASATDTFQLNYDYCSTLCFPAGGSAGMVALTFVAAGEVDVVVTLDSPLHFHDTTAFDTFVFNYIGAGALTADNITSGFSGLLIPGGRKEDGACSPANDQCFTDGFDFTGASGAGGDSGVSILSFHLHSSSFADVAAMRTDLETQGGANSNANVDFAAAVTTTGLANNCTGVVGGGIGTSDGPGVGSGTGTCTSNTSVPEPTSVLLLGTVLAFVGKFLKGRLAA